MSRFLRYLYTGSYAVLDQQGVIIPVSLLMHAELYYYGNLYDVPDLCVQTHRQIGSACEMASYVPIPPEGLFKAIKFIYKNYRDNGLEVRETILHYCINCFIYHQFDKSETFRKLLVEEKAFEQDLFRVNIERKFQDAGKCGQLINFWAYANVIQGSSKLIQMQLPNLPNVPPLPEYLFDMFGSSDSTPFPTPLLQATRSPEPSYSLVHCPRREGKMPTTDDSDGYSSEGSLVSDLDGFTLIGRSRSSFGSDTSRPSFAPGINPFEDAVEDPLQVDLSNPVDLDSDWSEFSDPGSTAPLAHEQDWLENEYRPRRSMYNRPDLASSVETIINFGEITAASFQLATPATEDDDTQSVEDAVDRAIADALVAAVNDVGLEETWDSEWSDSEEDLIDLSIED